MTEPTHPPQPEPPPADGQDVVAPASAPAEPTPPASSSPEEVVPGERLGTPPGATKYIADYDRPHPSYPFLALVSIAALVADVATKAWAERRLDGYPGIVEVWKGHVTLLLAKNRGGAWGLLQTTSENVRRPFFLLVSVAAIAFIMTLYRRLLFRQHALKWGLPLVLGGALGNVLDRIRYGHVIDFIDVHVVYRSIERHWPTFNVADIAICVGVGLMAIDMFTSKRGRGTALRAPRVPPAQSGEPVPEWPETASEAAPFADDAPLLAEPSGTPSGAPPPIV